MQLSTVTQNQHTPIWPLASCWSRSAGSASRVPQPDRLARSLADQIRVQRERDPDVSRRVADSSRLCGPDPPAEKQTCWLSKINRGAITHNKNYSPSSHQHRQTVRKAVTASRAPYGSTATETVLRLSLWPSVDGPLPGRASHQPTHPAVAKAASQQLAHLARAVARQHDLTAGIAAAQRGASVRALVERQRPHASPDRHHCQPSSVEDSWGAWYLRS